MCHFWQPCLVNCCWNWTSSTSYGIWNNLHHNTKPPQEIENLYVKDKRGRTRWTGRKSSSCRPRCSLSHSSDCVQCCAVGLSTRISSAEWTTLLYQTETSVVGMLPWALGWMEGRLLKPGLLVLKLQTATWVKKEGRKWERKRWEGDVLLQTGTA